MKLVLATRNQGKLRELRELFVDLSIEVVSLDQFPAAPEVEEDGATFVENARKKALSAMQATGCFALADDSGICVEALGGAPGVHSALYDGPHRDAAKHNEKLLQEMKAVPPGKRQAAFVCAMALAAPGGRLWEVEGRCIGEVAFEMHGESGFGYDPIFFLPDKGKTFAELLPHEKHAVSHRGKALQKIREILIEVLREGT